MFYEKKKYRISLKKKMPNNFLEIVCDVCFQIIYLRDIYPNSIFVKKKKYRTPVMMSEHPWVSTEHRS